MKLTRVLLYMVVGISTVGTGDCFWWSIHNPESVEKPEYTSPIYEESDIYFLETFDDALEFNRDWVESKGAKEIERDGNKFSSRYDGVWSLSPPDIGLAKDMGLLLKSEAKHAAISCRLNKPYHFNGKPLIVQYEVTFQEGQKCGGAYLKLLTAEKASLSLTKFNDRTPYSIMFGPDKCGTNVKLHFIFRHRNPINGSFEEKHCTQPSTRIDDNFEDKNPHLYRLIVKADNTFKIFVDRRLVHSGSLLKDFSPPVNPPAEIDDPDDKKPEDWDDRQKVPDQNSQKPDDWDENAPEMIADPKAIKPDNWLDNEPPKIHDPFAEKPDDWNEEADGIWEAPMVPNPACEDAPGCGEWNPSLIHNPNYKGKWQRPLIDNPKYQGKWSPRRIPNPEYFEDKNPYNMAPIGAVGFELWAITPKILFDNIIVTDKLDVADDLAAKTYDLKMLLVEGYNESLFTKFVRFTNSFPWLWAVYVVLLLIFITILAVWCCFPTAKEKKISADVDTDKNVDSQEGIKEENEACLIQDKDDIYEATEYIQQAPQQDSDWDEDIEISNNSALETNNKDYNLSDNVEKAVPKSEEKKETDEVFSENIECKEE